MALDAGATVGRYRIEGLLGSGGMGEVYKAADPTLNRPIALKVLRPELSRDPERLSRFLQEARAASALNHPNILTIHEVGDHDQSRFLVSEFVEGETLRQRLARGSLTLREILDIMIQASSALAAAHAASIVHRDIKPDNLMLRPDGYVKVLDFGVATMVRSKQPDAMATMAATMDAPETGAGMIVGTIAYMSPEQARGLPVDGRADCYSLGVVLYELVTGRAPFSAPTTTDLLVAILEREPPPVRTIAKGLPHQLEWIIEKSLEKDPNLRYQTMADLRVDLQRLKSALESGRLSSSNTIDATAAAVDAVVERELTEDSEEVARLTRVSWPTWGLSAAAVALLAFGMTYYNTARPGADLPLELPEGAVVTKARDVVEGFGYGGFGSKSQASFSNALSVESVNAAAGLDAARQAVREGAVAYWRAGITHTANPSGSNMEPAEGDYSVRLDPRGQMLAFATGYSKDTGITHVDRATATSIGVDAIKKAYGVDVSGSELEFVERSFPAGKTEMTWRSTALRFGFVDQFKVNLQGSKLVLIERSLQRPRDYKAPTTPMAMRIFKGVGPAVMVGVVVIGWAFGLYFLFKTKNWDALTRRMPLAMCALVLVSVGLGTIGSNGAFESAISIIAIGVMLIGMVLPALSGVMLWLNRRNPAALWAAEQVTHGRLSLPAVSVSVFEGAAAGAAMAGVFVLADRIALQVPGFDPSISRELDIVDAGIGSIVGNSLSAAAFIVLGFALALETGDRWRVPKMLSAAIVAIVAGCFAASDQEKILPALVLLGGGAIATVLVIWMYRTRGFLAAFIAGLVAGLLNNVMAARSLEDGDLARRANLLMTIVVLVAAAAAWGVGRRLMQKSALHPGAKLGIHRG